MSYENAIRQLRDGIRDWQSCIDESKAVIANIDRNVSCQEAVIKTAEAAIAELTAAIAKLEGPPMDER
jgi:hypothetical protein